MFWLGVTQALEAQRIQNLNMKKAEKMEERIFNINRLTRSEYTKCKEALKEKNMTRQEAIQKISAIFRSDVSGSLRNIQDFVDGLENLGLLKFEEPLNTARNIIKLNQGESPECIIEELRKGGFKILPIDK